MEAKIGVAHTAKELVVEIDGAADDVERLIGDALASGERMLWLTDRRGRRVGIPTDKLAYVECSADEARRVGFARG